MKARNRILVAEDEIDTLHGLQKYLTSKGYEVDVAMDGLEAAEKVSAQPFDVVVSDLKMPHMDGIELLHRTKEVNNKVAFIIITGFGTVESAIEAMKLGAADFISKPLAPSHLVSVIEKALEKGDRPLEPMPGSADRSIKIRRCHLEHTWYAIQTDGTVKIGADEEFFRSTGEIIYCDLPFESDSIAKGQVCVRTVNSGQTIRKKLRAPLSGTVVKINQKMLSQPWLGQNDAFGEGWLMTVIPSRLEEEI